jgi:hypothetical protein
MTVLTAKCFSGKIQRRANEFYYYALWVDINCKALHVENIMSRVVSISGKIKIT